MMLITVILLKQTFSDRAKRESCAIWQRRQRDAHYIWLPLSSSGFSPPHAPPVSSTICRRNLDSSCHRRESSWSLPHEVSETAAADQLATVHPKWRGCSDHRLAVDLGSRQQPSYSALFGHVARLHQDVPAHKALHCHVDLFLGRPPNDQWKRRPGRPWDRDGSIRSGRTMESPRRICGDVRRIVVTEEQRYGPRWLRVNDDDDAPPVSPIFSPCGTLSWKSPGNLLEMC